MRPNNSYALLTGLEFGNPDNSPPVSIFPISHPQNIISDGQFARASTDASVSQRIFASLPEGNKPPIHTQLLTFCATNSFPDRLLNSSGSLISRSRIFVR